MTSSTTCEVFVDGVRFADGSAGDSEDEPTALSGLSIVWGRDTTVDQPAPAVCSFSVIDPPGGASFIDELHTGLAVEVFASDLDAGLERSVIVFAGRITNLAGVFDDALGAPRVDVTAADFTADLANVQIGAEPWLAEPMAARFERILELAAGGAIGASIDPELGALLVSWLDVDRQPADGLLKSLAESVDGVLWPSVDPVTGPFLLVENPGSRLSQAHLELVDGLVVIVIGAGAADTLSACDVLRDPVTFVQDVSDVLTRAAVTWKAQTLDDDGLPAPTETTETLIDAELEARFGIRSIELTTELAASEDALDVAGRLLARLSSDDWRASGFVVDADDLVDAAGVRWVLDLLDNTTRPGLAIRVIDLPPWSPTAAPELALYVEGGSYSFLDGRWILELGVSSARGLGDSAAWNELDPAWRWIDFDPSIRWIDLIGVAGTDSSTTMEGAA